MWGYYILRDRLPYFLFLLYEARRRWPSAAKVLDHVSITLAVQPLLLSTLAAATMIKYQTTYIPFLDNNMSGRGPVTWGMFLCLVWVLCLRQGQDPTTALTLAGLATSTCGWLYEIPLFIVWGGDLLRVNDNNVIYISGQIISLPLLIYLLHRKGVTINRRTSAAAGLYILYATSYILVPELKFVLTGWFGNWWERIPTIIMMLTWISTIKPLQNKT